MKKAKDLENILWRIDGKGYKAYKDIKGEYAFRWYTLFIDHVQGDPYAAPSRVRVRVERKSSGFLPETTSNRSRQVALYYVLTRDFHINCKKYSRGTRGIGKSGIIVIDRAPQEILDRTSMRINAQFVEARFFMGLPATGRRISGKDAQTMFFEELPRIVRSSLYMDHLDRSKIYNHIESSDDADFLRSRLNEMGLVGFVENGSLLPRASGIDPSPMDNKDVVLFRSPESLEKEFNLPNRGRVSGMGVPKGVTLIVGGGYHGKSTLLNALELGVYNHIPGDSRELAVTLPETVKIRAADGRNIQRTDISPFIQNLPFRKETDEFCTENASGSTSQSANISEALEAGARVLLLDEDTSATNFMIRDHRMQLLVSKAQEPITPFIDKVRQLFDEKGVSTVLVMGGSGDYFSVADHVIQMINYIPEDVTQQAHDIAKNCSTGRLGESGDRFGNIKDRIPLPEGFNPYRGRHHLKIAAPRHNEILFGRTTIDLGDLEQIVSISQTRGIGYAIQYATRYMNGNDTLKVVVDRTLNDIYEKGLEILTPYLTGDIAGFRGIELAGAINRMRTLKVRQKA
ncbi:MAG: ABC-ATPase domain-containing protein [Thermodesulfobacteriota bacterium]|nr:ABC-ATPase domain-containing protein [Thermodesulfobacteriota bacterium]